MYNNRLISMTKKTRLLLLSVIVVQAACTETPIKPPATKKSSQVHTAKSAHIEAFHYKNEPVTVEEIPLPKPVIQTAPSISIVEPKPRPALPEAVQVLMTDALRNTKAGDLGSASVMLERALRISPRSAELTYQLATLRLKQSQPRLAEDLGKKAAFLAVDDRELKKRCWLLIVEARQLQGNLQGAKEAQLKVDSLQ